MQHKQLFIIIIAVVGAQLDIQMQLLCADAKALPLLSFYLWQNKFQKYSVWKLNGKVIKHFYAYTHTAQLSLTQSLPLEYNATLLSLTHKIIENRNVNT